MNKIDFYYWADQCPHNFKIIQMLKQVGGAEGCTINCFDISKDYNIAAKLNIFSPNMMIFNDSIRLHGPVIYEKVRSILNGDRVEKKPYTVRISHNIIKGEVRDITEDSILDTCVLCASSKEQSHCSYKSEWIKKLRKDHGVSSIGKLHYFNGECIGGAEFLPVEIVPYPIPKEKGQAFLTCVFGTSEEGDYKSYPLELLEKELVKLGYVAIIAIASEDTPFPNGPLQWFLDRGYDDLGFIYNEERHFARMHLIKKTLKIESN